MHARWMMLLAAVGLLAVPAGAQAGGWAAVELSSTPDGLRPGEPWVVELTILQHGRTPLEGVAPKVAIEKAGGGEQRTVPAKPTGRPGVYRARVTFPSAGRWEYVVDDGFTQRHTYPPVRIGGATAAAAAAERTGGATGAPPAADGGGAPWLAIAAALAAALLAAGLTTLLGRTARGRSARRGPADRPAATEG
jgi:YtkA-like